MAMPAKIPMIATTTSSSINVNPDSLLSLSLSIKHGLRAARTGCHTSRIVESPSNAGAVGMGRRKHKRVCARGRIHAADGRAHVVTLRRATGECPGLIGIVLRKVSLFGGRGVS